MTKVTYESGADQDTQESELSDEIVAALQDLPIRAAGFALIGLFCPHEDVNIEFVRIGGTAKDGKPFGDLTVTFGDRCEDVIKVNLG